LELADRGTRLVAVIVDGLMIGGLAIVAAIVIPILAPSGGGEPNPVVLGAVMLLVFGGMLALLIVNLLWLHRYGQTIAKRMFNIKVVRSDGGHCALGRIILARWLPITVLGMIPLLGYAVSLADALFIFRDDRRCLHDLIADTIVVKV
jgi:uncharacterized RDD family membrane protein YckC